MSQPDVLRIHHEYIAQHPPLLAFDPSKNFIEQKQVMADKYRELIRMPVKKTSPAPIIETVIERDPRFDEIRFRFESEPGFYVPAHLLLPKDIQNRPDGERLPVVICLQGHSSGMHISLGRVRYPGDEDMISSGDRDFAIQAAAHGFAAVTMEQRGFGELDGTVSPGTNRCQQASMQALLLGRTLVGERVFDVSCLVDALAGLPHCDLERIGLMGNSGGGTTTFYAACADPRIRLAMPSCSFCSLGESVFALHHCVCNYIPELFRYFEMGDLALLLFPRPFIVVCGRQDPIFPFSGVQREFATVRKIYAAGGAPDQCRLIVGEGGHRFYAEPSWPVYAQMLENLD